MHTVAQISDFPGLGLGDAVLFINSWDLIYSCSKLFLPCLILSVVWCSDQDLRFLLRGLKAQPTVFAIKRELFRQELAFRKHRNVPVVCSSGCSFFLIGAPWAATLFVKFRVVLLFLLHRIALKLACWTSTLPFLMSILQNAFSCFLRYQHALCVFCNVAALCKHLQTANRYDFFRSWFVSIPGCHSLYALMSMVSCYISNVTALYKYPQHQTVRVFVQVLVLQKYYMSGVRRIRSCQAESIMELFVPSFKGIELCVSCGPPWHQGAALLTGAVLGFRGCALCSNGFITCFLVEKFEYMVPLDIPLVAFMPEVSREAFSMTFSSLHSLVHFMRFSFRKFLETWLSGQEYRKLWTYASCAVALLTGAPEGVVMCVTCGSLWHEGAALLPGAVLVFHVCALASFVMW